MGFGSSKPSQTSSPVTGSDPLTSSKISSPGPQGECFEFPVTNKSIDDPLSKRLWPYAKKAVIDEQSSRLPMGSTEVCERIWNKNMSSKRGTSME